MTLPFDQFFPPKPHFTEKELPDQTGKVFFITGAASGIGYELARILFGANGTVCLAARSPEKIQRAITSIRAADPASSGRLEALVLDLSDLSTIKPAVNDFLAKEIRLDVLFQNAGVMLTPVDAKSAQGHELQMATNCLGHHLLAHLLTPLMAHTAADKQTAKDSVRIVWLASTIAIGTPQGGVVWDEHAGAPKLMTASMDNYMQSKVGNLFLAHEWGNRLRSDGIVNVAVNPGNMNTNLQRNSKALQVMMGLLFKPAVYGAYSELFAGLSPEIKPDNTATFIIPWGRFGKVPDHIALGTRTQEEGGSGLAPQFWDFCESSTRSYK